MEEGFDRKGKGTRKGPCSKVDTIMQEQRFVKKKKKNIEEKPDELGI